MPALATPAAPVNVNDFAKPGESILDFETRLGTTKAGPGTGFGTPQPIAPALVAKTTPAPTPTAPSTDSTGESGGSSGGSTDNSQLDTLAQSLGYKNYSDALTQLTAPSSDTTGFYNSAYAAAGLDTLNNQIESRKNDLNTATGNINDNPWLDEASRVGRVKNLTTLAEGDINNLNTEYNTKLKGVEDLVTQHSKDLDATAASNKTKLSFLEAQAKAIATQQATSAKTAAAPPKTIKGANGATFQYDSTTGQFTQILPGKTAADSTTKTKTPVPAASPTGTGSQFNNFNFSATQLGALNAKGLSQDHANTILGEIKQGYTLDDIRNQMKASGVDPGLLDEIMLYVDPAHNTPAKPTSTKATSGRSL